MTYNNPLKRRKKGQLPAVDLKILNDAEVLKHSVKDPNAFEEIVSRYQRSFVRKAREIIGNEDGAYDAVQDTFVRIYAAGKKFKPEHEDSFKAWAYKILTRQCYTLYSKEKRRAQWSQSLSPELVEVIPDENEREAHEHALSMENAFALVSKLPAKLRRVIQLYFIEGAPQKEIAVSEHLTPVAVRVRIHRAKRELRRMSLEAGANQY